MPKKGPTESVVQACARHGHTRAWIRRRLIAIGAWVDPGRGNNASLDPSVVDRAVREHERKLVCIDCGVAVSEWSARCPGHQSAWALVLAARRRRAAGIKRSTSRPWSAADDAEFTSLYLTMPIDELGAKLVRNKWALYRRATDLGIARSARGTESRTQAAARHGVSPKTMDVYLDRAGIPHGRSVGKSGRGFWIRLNPSDVDRAVGAYVRAKPWSKTT